MGRTSRHFVVWGCLLAACISVGDSSNMVHAQHPYRRPVGQPHQSRSVSVAGKGMVAASQPLAAQIGLEILKSGGTAADAAIATNAALGLMEPMSCGIGGDLFVLYWDAKTAKLYGLNASGRSPYRLNRQVFREKGLTSIPGNGPLSWSVPGCVDGWDVLHRRFGKLPLSQILASPANYAEEGFAVTELISEDWEGVEGAGERYPDLARTYLNQGRAPRVGELFRNRDLAHSYRLIAEGGRDAYYKGEIARKIVTYSDRVGGYFSQRDFDEQTSNWVDPVTTNYRGYDVWQIPPNGQGGMVLQMLNILEGYDLKRLGAGSADYLHLLIEAKKLAYADRAKFYADPEFGKLPTATLISKEYAAERRKLISLDRAAEEVFPGDPKLALGDTVYLTVVDAERNCCSFIQSNFAGFGSLMVADGTGFVLQNRGCSFALDDTHANRLEPHKRPFHTIIPGFVTLKGKPWMSFGVMGGDMQPQGQVQVLINQIDFQMNPQEAGDFPRVQHFGSATPNGAPGQGSGVVGLEAGFSEETIRSLQQRGHHVRMGGAFGGYQAIRIHQERGTLTGATESRKDGMAIGY